MSIYDEAVLLASEYGIPVFPCRADKKPATKNGFKDATMNLEQIDQWFLNSDFLVAVPTGGVSRLLVVDIDPHGADWYTAHAANLACARIHKTRRGWHLVYRMPAQSIPCSAGDIAPGVDVRADGGYVVWWPATGLEVTGDLEDLALPPDWLLALLRKDDRKGAQPATGSRIVEGARNVHLTRQAGRLRRAGLAGDALAAALQAVNTAQCAPPLPEAEVTGILKAAAGWEGGERERAPIPYNDIIIPTLAEIVEKPVAPRTWFFKGVIPAGAFLIVGRPKVGKSWLILQLLVAFCRRTDFLGYPHMERDP